jgi:hypothetical protein
LVGDGVYSARFDQYAGMGAYAFELTATNATGHLVPGETFGGTIPAAIPAPPFMRTAAVTAIVTGTCAAGVSFESVACRIAALRVGAEGVSLGRLEERLLRRLTTAQAVVLDARAKCDAGALRTALSSLRRAAWQLTKFSWQLRSLRGRQEVGATDIETLSELALGIATDTKALRTEAACP